MACTTTPQLVLRVFGVEPRLSTESEDKGRNCEFGIEFTRGTHQLNQVDPRGPTIVDNPLGSITPMGHRRISKSIHRLDDQAVIHGGEKDTLVCKRDRRASSPKSLKSEGRVAKQAWHSVVEVQATGHQLMLVRARMEVGLQLWRQVER